MEGINWEYEVIKRQDLLLKDLIGLLSIQSVKDPETSTTDQPMGKAIGEALRFMLDLGKRDGFPTKNIEGYAGYLEYGESDDYIGVLSHIDVVPATGKWTTPPFEPTVRDGKLFARGAIDDKGPTIAAYYALKILKEMGISLNHRIRLIIGTDEESGMSCMKRYFELEDMPMFGFSPDADFPIIHAEKGQINIQLGVDAIVDKERNDAEGLQLLSFQAGDRPNMVPGEATATIKVADNEVTSVIEHFKSYLGDNHLKGSYNTDGTQINLKLEGKTVHGMAPYNGINAGVELMHFLRNVGSKNVESKNVGSNVGSDPSYPHPTYPQFIDQFLYHDYYGEKLGINVSDNILGPLTVNAGIMSYHHQDGGTLSLNIRCPLATDYAITKKTLEDKANEHGWKVLTYRQTQPHHVDQDHPMIQTMQRVYQEQTGDDPVLLSTGGGTYARFMEKGVAFGACFPGREMTAHQVDEYIEIKDLFKATAIYAQTLYELSQL